MEHLFSQRLRKSFALMPVFPPESHVLGYSGIQRTTYWRKSFTREHRQSIWPRVVYFHVHSVSGDRRPSDPVPQSWLEGVRLDTGRSSLLRGLYCVRVRSFISSAIP